MCYSLEYKLMCVLYLSLSSNVQLAAPLKCIVCMVYVFKNGLPPISVFVFCTFINCTFKKNNF